MRNRAIKWSIRWAVLAAVVAGPGLGDARADSDEPWEDSSARHEEVGEELYAQLERGVDWFDDYYWELHWGDDRVFEVRPQWRSSGSIGIEIRWGGR